MARKFLEVALVPLLMLAAIVLPATVSARGSQACEIVALDPGYPEFQGYVPGIWYAPEFVCRDYLETNYPEFSIEKTDQANQQSAASLGIEGTREDWTWENWIAISAAQGYPQICWSCAFLGTTPINHPGGSDVDTTDPRFASGMYGDRYFITMEYAPNSAYRTFSDFQIRVTSSLIWGDPYITAPQLISHYLELVNDFETTGSSLDPSQLWNVAVEWGGHFPVSGSLVPQDQIFFLLLALDSIVGFNDAYVSVMGDQIVQAGDAWTVELAQGATTLPFKDYFRENWSDQ